MIRKPPPLSVLSMGESVPEDQIKRVERELAKEDSLLANMREQAPGMLGMAFMFIITIALGIWLQPWFNAAGLQAFGESGATQARWIMLELVAIFAFTFLILWLAKKHMEKVIKYGLLSVLFLALCYTTIPGAHILLVPDVETEAFVFTESEQIEEKIVSLNTDGTMVTQIVNWEDSFDNHSFVISKRSANTSLEWSFEISSSPGEPIINVIEGTYAYTVTNGAWIWSFDKDDGEILSKYACFDDSEWDGTVANISMDPNISGCVTALEVVETPSGELNESKGAIYITTPGNELLRRNTFHETNFTSHQAKWSYPQLQLNEKILKMTQYDEDSLLFVTPIAAVMIHLEEFSDPFAPGQPDPGGWVDECTVEWYNYIEDDNSITAFNIVTSPWDDEESLAMVGYLDGEIQAFIIDEDIKEGQIGNYSEETRFHGDGAFTGPITAIDSFDLNERNGNELWIADADGIHGLFYSSLIEYATFDIVLTNESMMSASDLEIRVIHTGTIDELNSTYSMEIQTGVFDEDTMYNSYGIQWSDTATLVGLILAIILMAALIFHPEWYVVNTVGVLVGGGVIVMLGVTFVPTLIVIFMILAALYDAWAVYRSKHMLDLADTMIGLNLPILLVAPQESGYSMLEEKSSIRPPESLQSKDSPGDSAVVIPKKRKKPKEAMFMGLGDVIFPGMLVVSCVDSIPTGGLAVGIAALIGGLVGYFVLMGYVASGRPQAGLPLLNGGAILGYIIGGLIFVGSTAFSFGISF
jgi:presenilin-like A22 family membrane protease